MKRCLCILAILLAVFRRPVGEVFSKGWDIIQELPTFITRIKSWAVVSWNDDLKWRGVFIVIFLWLLYIVVRKIILYFCRRYASAKAECLIADDPIEREDDDRLGRMAYAKTILALLERADPRKSQVVGIYGKWGEGKTSAVKLLECLCRKEGVQTLRFVWFRPWSSVARKDINADMFIAIQAAIRKCNPLTALLMLQYACRQTVHLIPDSNGLLEILSVLLASLCNVFASVDTVKASLKRKLEHMSKRFVVVIDDIDRLTCDEAGEVIRCLKTNGDLPNVTYLVLTNEALLSIMLQDKYGLNKEVDRDEVVVDETRNFLEKIVTYPMPLWPIPKDALKQELKRLVVGVLSRYGLAVGEIGDKEYDFVIAKCETLRTIKRLVVSFDLVLAYYVAFASEDEQRLNIHVGDAFCLSAVRLISPSSIGIIFSTYGPWVRYDIIKATSNYHVAQSDFDAFMGKVPQYDREWILKFVQDVLMVHEIHGQNGKMYEPVAAKDDLRNIAKSFRLASSYHFERYFMPSELPGKVVPRDMILNYFRKAHAIEEFKVWFKECIAEYGLVNFLDAVRKCCVSVTYVASYDVAVVTDWIVSVVKDFVDDNALINASMDCACLIMAEYFERAIIAEGMRLRDAPTISDWIIKTRSYSTCCYWLLRGVGQLEPEESFFAEPSKIDGVEAVKLWRWLKEELHCKIFEDDVAARPDSEFVRRLWNWLVIFKCPTDGATFAEHVDYLCRSMDSEQCMQRLKSLGRYEYDINTGIGELDYMYYMGNYRETYIKILFEAEKAFVKYADKMIKEDCDIYSAACRNIQTPLGPTADEIVRKHSSCVGA